MNGMIFLLNGRQIFIHLHLSGKSAKTNSSLSCLQLLPFVCLLPLFSPYQVLSAANLLYSQFCPQLPLQNRRQGCLLRHQQQGRLQAPEEADRLLIISKRIGIVKGKGMADALARDTVGEAGQGGILRCQLI